MTPTAVIFAGGGTGGHIFPAIAIAEHLCATDLSSGQCSSPLPVAYLCSTRAIDRRILQPRAVDFTPIPASPFSLHPAALARFITGWRPAVRACRQAIAARCEQWNTDPSSCVLVATGGFVCAPAAAAARSLGCRVALVNLDAVPGKAARLLAHRADAVFTTYPALGLEPVGPIVRNQARAPAPPQDCRARLGLHPDLHTLVVSGASQGATSINAFVLALVRDRPEIFEGWQILHQAGPDRADAVEAGYRDSTVPAKVVGLIDEVGLLWGSATLALARSGAGTVAEICANNIPAFFMPYPYHRDHHQRLNAKPAVDAGLAEILEDLIDPDRNLAAHADRVAARLRSPPHPNPKTEASDGAPRIAETLRKM